MNPKNKLAEMPVRPLLYTMAVPLMLSLLIQSLYNIVDSIFVARLSETALTAASLVYAIQFLMIAMLAFGVPALRIISVTFLFAVTTILCGYFASGLGNGVVNMIGGALRQLVVLVPCLWLLIRTMGIEKAWFAFWVSEVIACAYSLWATKKELRNKEK